MRFGIFDHLDDGGVPLGQLFEERLKLVEAYDRAGFYGYHLAEHHATPLGYAPSPSVFLSAVAQRTRQLRFGPMVYLLPLYHPLRLIEEICMLDQMSGGRFLFGVGRGISPVEVGFFGVDFAHGMQQYEEALAVIRLWLTHDELTYHGKFYKFDAVPIVLKPAQLPHPPLWYGISRLETIPWAAENDVNLVSFLRPVSAMRPLVEQFQAEWTALRKPPDTLPRIGVTRHVVVAETEKEARNIHNTPLGYAPSPGVFLAAVAQRTRQLRFGPMVYLLPLYHPLRLIDDPGRGQAVDRAICRGGHAGLCRSLIGKIPKRIVSPFRRPRGTGGHAQPSRSP